jgi:NMD protein affecting ribosome stability and mRNA decay
MYKNSWRKFLSKDLEENIRKVVGELFSKNIVVNSEVELKNVEILVEVPKNLKVANGNLVNLNLSINVVGRIKDTEVEESYQIPMKVTFSLCNNCKKLKGRYFEAKLQLRPKSDKILNFVKSYCETRKHLFISKIEESKFGYDLYMSDQRETRSLGSLLRKKFGGEVKESKKLFGKKDGKEIYRATVLFRLDE